MPNATMTSATGNTAPAVPFGAADGQPEAIRPDQRPSGRPPVRFPAGRLSPGALGYQKFRTNDSDAVRRFFASAYTPGWRIDGIARRSAVTHQRCETGSMTLDEVLIQGRVDCEISAAESYVVIQPRAGSFTVTGESVPAAD
ncbi:MAG: hypothetical protein QOH91_2665, partial [Mycobacterium sp.]|nr:hypothetical protein [Mycobacterium sp.]